MKKLFASLAFISMAVLLLTLTPTPSMALAETTDSSAVNKVDKVAAVMPTKRTFTTYKTARSAATGGFAYIYIKVDATVDANYGKVMSIDGVYAYQADASRNFVKWEKLSLNYKNLGKSIWAKTTGYVYFKSSSGFQDKYYIEVEKTWNV